MLVKLMVLKHNWDCYNKIYDKAAFILIMNSLAAGMRVS